MKKFCILLLSVLFVSYLYSQEQRYYEFRCPVGESKGNMSFGYWNKYNLYYYIHNYPSNSNLTSTQCDAAILSAFNKWSYYSLFTFTRTYDLSQADIELKWVSGPHSNCDYGNFVLGEAAHSSEGKTSQTPPSYIHFNDIIPFTMTSSGINLEVVALNQIGHVLGLEHDTTHSSAVMYYDGNYHYNIDITSYDYNALYNIYGFPTAIEGPRYICSHDTCYINNLDKLPSNFTVSWSLDDSNYYAPDYLVYNYPYKGACIIARNPNHDMTGATLTAQIKKNGTVIKTLTKSNMYAYSGFRGNYTSGNLSGNIDYTYFFHVKTYTATTVFSPNFYDATVTYSSSGVTPTAWGYNSDTGVLNFKTSVSNAAVIINVTDCSGNNYTLYAYGVSQYKLNVSNGDSDITVSLVEGDDSERGISIDQPWTVEVRNVTTGLLMANLSSTSRSESISTVGWPKGVYIVKVTIGEEELTEKVIVR